MIGRRPSPSRTRYMKMKRAKTANTCSVRASSNILSISAWTSARQVDRELERSITARFDGLFSNDRFANEISASTRVIIILEHNEIFNVIISV